MKDLIKKDGREKDFLIQSSATSYEEEGSPVHYRTRKILEQLNISCAGKRAVRLEKSDLTKYDYFIGMEEVNLKNIKRILGDGADGKISLLLDYAGENRGVTDPYWTGDFDKTFEDVKKGVEALYNFLKKTSKSIDNKKIEC